MNMEEVFSAVRKRRLALGLTQAELASLSGVSLHAIINLELGRASPTLRTLMSVCEILGYRLELSFVHESEGVE